MAEGSCERIALYLDLENLVHPLGPDPCSSRARRLLGSLVRLARARRTVVRAVACGAPRLVVALAWDLGELGVITLPHGGGRDAADRRLLDDLGAGLPRSVTTVLIGSGDRAFAPAARTLRARGLRVEAFSWPGAISAELLREVDGWYPLDGFTAELAA